MTPIQYRAAIKKLGLSQNGAARFLGVHSRTSQRWALGELPVPLAVEMLFGLMLALNIEPEWFSRRDKLP